MLHKQRDTALGASVINESSTLGGFPASNAVDGMGVTTPQLGVSVTEFYPNGYWLNNVSGTAFFIVDLGASSPIGEFRLANTFNGGIGDRFANTFEILASNSISTGNTPLGPNNNGTHLVSP